MLIMTDAFLDFTEEMTVESDWLDRVVIFIVIQQDFSLGF